MKVGTVAPFAKEAIALRRNIMTTIQRYREDGSDRSWEDIEELYDFLRSYQKMFPETRTMAFAHIPHHAQFVYGMQFLGGAMAAACVLGEVNPRILRKLSVGRKHKKEKGK